MELSHRTAGCCWILLRGQRAKKEETGRHHCQLRGPDRITPRYRSDHTQCFATRCSFKPLHSAFVVNSEMSGLGVQAHPSTCPSWMRPGTLRRWGLALPRPKPRPLRVPRGKRRIEQPFRNPLVCGTVDRGSEPDCGGVRSPRNKNIWKKTKERENHRPRQARQSICPEGEIP